MTGGISIVVEMPPGVKGERERDGERERKATPSLLWGLWWMSLFSATDGEAR